MQKRGISLLIFILAMLCSLQLPGQLAAAIFASEEKILEGEEFAKDPMFQSVGWLRSPHPDGGGRLLGTGVLIEEQWVLTNGHVVLDGLELFSEISFNFANDILTDPFNPLPSEEVFVFPGYSDFDAPGTGIDLALVKLAEPVLDVLPAERFRGEDEIGRLIRAAGYGALGVFPEDAFNPSRGRETDGKKRAGEDTVRRFAVFPRNPAFMEIRFNQFSGQLPLEWASSPGDSGGGWFSEIDGRNQLVGINAYSAGLSDSGAVRVSLFNDWIDTTIAANSVPEPAAISMLLAGLGGSQVIRRRTA